MTLLFGCIATDYNPFEEDEYVPIGLQTESIVRDLTIDEQDMFDNGVARFNDYINVFESTTQARSYHHSYFGIDAPSSTNETDYSGTSEQEGKTYDNDVYVMQTSDTERYMGDQVDYTNITESTHWTFLPSPTTIETRVSESVNDGEAEVTSFGVNAYEEANDYDVSFGFGVLSFVTAFLTIADFTGMNADDEVVAFYRSSTYSQMSLARNGYAMTTNNQVLEVKFRLYEPEDESDPLYLPVQSRFYTEVRITTGIYHQSEVMTYLKRPIIVAYDEGIISYSSQSDIGDYTGEIPEVPAP